MWMFASPLKTPCFVTAPPRRPPPLPHTRQWH